MSGNGRGRRRRKRARKSCGGRKWPPVVMRVRGSRASRHRGAKLKAAVEQAKEARHHQMRQLHRALLKANTENNTLCRLLDEAVRLHDGTRKLRDQKDRIRSLSDDVGRLRHALKAAEAAKERLKARLLRATEAARSISPRAKDAQLRKFLRRSRRQKTTINELSRENARLRRTAKASRNRLKTLEAQLAKLHATRAVLSKALFGRKSEKQETPRSERRRGQQRGAPGHGRSQRPGLEKRTEVQNPPVNARACSCCGRRYVATGAEQSTLVEIEIRAHKRVIRRPRWRRTCDCASSPVEVSAPPLPRLFANTPYGRQRLVALPVRALRLPAPPAARSRLDVRPGAAALPGDAGRQRAPLRAAVRAAGRREPRAPEHGDAAPCRRDHVARTGASRRRPVEPRLAVDRNFSITPCRLHFLLDSRFGMGYCLAHGIEHENTGPSRHRTGPPAYPSTAGRSPRLASDTAVPGTVPPLGLDQRTGVVQGVTVRSYRCGRRSGSCPLSG